MFENISQIVDDSFNNYIVRQGSVEPLFAQFCDGVRTQCGGLSQWGSVDLARGRHERPMRFCNTTTEGTSALCSTLR